MPTLLTRSSRAPAPRFILGTGTGEQSTAGCLLGESDSESGGCRAVRGASRHAALPHARLDGRGYQRAVARVAGRAAVERISAVSGTAVRHARRRVHVVLHVIETVGDAGRDGD